MSTSLHPATVTTFLIVSRRSLTFTGNSARGSGERELGPSRGKGTKQGKRRARKGKRELGASSKLPTLTSYRLLLLLTTCYYYYSRIHTPPPLLSSSPLISPPNKSTTLTASLAATLRAPGLSNPCRPRFAHIQPLPRHPPPRSLSFSFALSLSLPPPLSPPPPRRRRHERSLSRPLTAAAAAPPARRPSVSASPH